MYMYQFLLSILLQVMYLGIPFPHKHMKCQYLKLTIICIKTVDHGISTKIPCALQKIKPCRKRPYLLLSACSEKTISTRKV